VYKTVAYHLQEHLFNYTTYFFTFILELGGMNTFFSCNEFCLLIEDSSVWGREGKGEKVESEIMSKVIFCVNWMTICLSPYTFVTCKWRNIHGIPGI
jgi:hypothetical protein